MNTKTPTLLPTRGFILLSMLLAAGTAQAAIHTIDVNGKVQGFGTPQKIGSIAVEPGKADGFQGSGHASFMNGYFTFTNAFKSLDDTYDFNWINVVRRETGPALGLFSKTPNMDPEMEDTFPHYYTEAEWITDNKLNGRTLRGDQSFTQFIDFPKQPKERGFDFSTFLILQDNNKFALDGKKQFLVLAGWEWNYQGDDDFDGSKKNGVSTFGKAVTIDKTARDLITEAMANGKDGRFNGWTVLETFTMVPSPATVALACLGGVIAARRRRG
ncbi:MAG: hypothetical protein KF787_06330 [Phycisphaeraceae bacterium]|nr:hypothetical protein [Phycisphaerae bacterium]MBX3392248.1 hypothetical protein [Phycisphaeraceae bacterium]